MTPPRRAEPLDDWGEPPTGTQLEEDIANAVVDGTVTQVAHDAHLGLAANLAKVPTPPSRRRTVLGAKTAG